MRNFQYWFALAFVAFFANGAGIANAGNIVCWKDANGKTIGCGNSVPPEYQDNGVREMNKKGRVIRDTNPDLSNAQTKEATENAAARAETHRAQEEQRRQDRALLNAFTTVSEIDDKFERDSALLQSNVDTLNTNLKNNQARQTTLRERLKNRNDAPTQDALERLTKEEEAINQQIAQKQQQIDDLTANYKTTRNRFIELRGEQANSSTR